MRCSRFTAPRHLVCSSVLLLVVTFVTGCSQTPDERERQTHPAPSEPESRVVDYQQVDCEQIWTFDTRAAIDNPLYWLRAMDCAQRLSPAEARAEARRWPGSNWHDRFKQAVLLNNGKVSPFERHQYLQRFDDVDDDYPAAVRPLITVWREGQGALLQLSAERTRYSNLQQSNDAQLELLRQQQTSLHHELVQTQQKLKSLTDIERQLSSRRSPDAADNAHESDKSMPGVLASPSASKSEDDTTP